MVVEATTYETLITLEAVICVTCISVRLCLPQQCKYFSPPLGWGWYEDWVLAVDVCLGWHFDHTNTHKQRDSQITAILLQLVIGSTEYSWHVTSTCWRALWLAFRSNIFPENNRWRLVTSYKEIWISCQSKCKIKNFAFILSEWRRESLHGNFDETINVKQYERKQKSLLILITEEQM